MRKILSEKNFAGFLFVVALVVFSFAQQDAKKAEKMSTDNVSSIISAPRQTADATDAGKTENITARK